MIPWDTGIEWRTEVSSVNPAFLAIDVAFIRDRVLRAFTGDIENYLIEHYIRAATALGERQMAQHIAPKTLTLTMSGFPATGIIELVDNPVRAVTSISYVAEDGTETAYGGSPPSWRFLSGGSHRRALVMPGYAEKFPTARAQADAVTLAIAVGYASADEVPFEIQQALAVTVGEFYKNPDLSNADGQSPNLLGLSHFWPLRWTNGI